MERVEHDGVRIEYELLDGGKPTVVLPHARPFVSWYSPLAGALDRATLRYRRSVPPGRSWRIEDDAVLCARLLTRLGIERPDVVGHSYGGLVALELARDHGVDPRSVALLEPDVPGALDEAIVNADAFFAVEFPAAIRWSFALADVREDLPVLTIRGTESAPRSVEAAEIVHSWFPRSAFHVLDGASHLLVAEEPAAIAKRLTEFWASPTNGTFDQT